MDLNNNIIQEWEKKQDPSPTIKIRITQEMIQDLRNYHGIDISRELELILENEIE